MKPETKHQITNINLEKLIYLKKELPDSIQGMLCVFGLFLAYPLIDIFGLSITFYIFLVIIVLQVRSGCPIITPHSSNKWFVLLFIAGAISTLFHPKLDTEVSFLLQFKTIVQFAYWIIMAMYFRSNFMLIDWSHISKWFFYGLIVMVLSFYFSDFRFEFWFVKVKSQLSRNAFVFNFLCFFPITFWYLLKSKFQPYLILIVLIFFVALIFTNGRAGFILIVIQSILMGIVIYPKASGLLRLSLICLFTLFLIWKAGETSPLMMSIAKQVEKVNPRMAGMITKESISDDLSTDKSWLIRKLMIDKAIEIVKQYPALGIGWFNFSKYGADLNTINQYERLNIYDDEFLNTRSSHNSYAMYLAEGGIIGFTLLLIILLLVALPFIKKLVLNRLSIRHLPLIALATILIYFYVITAITGTNTWFVIGAAFGCIKGEK